LIDRLGCLTSFPSCSSSVCALQIQCVSLRADSLEILSFCLLNIQSSSFSTARKVGNCCTAQHGEATYFLCLWRRTGNCDRSKKPNEMRIDFSGLDPVSLHQSVGDGGFDLPSANSFASPPTFQLPAVADVSKLNPSLH
jgi:hypothetical protein